MKKYFFIIALCTVIIFQKTMTKVFSEALADFMLAEKDLLNLYRQADPKDRPGLEAQMLRAGIAPEVIKAEPILFKPAVPVSVPAVPPATAAPTPVVKTPADTGELTDTQLQEARKGLRKTTPNAPKTFAPLPGKPTETELQEAIAERARKRELQQ